MKNGIYWGIFLFIMSCSTMKVSDRNQYGYFNETINAQTAKKEKINLDSLKSLILVPNGSFVKGMVEEVSYFDTVLTFDEYERSIILDHKQDEIGSISGLIGLNIASRKYKHFLYLTIAIEGEKDKKVQLKLINPETIEELFVAQIDYSPMGGIYDNNTFNPLFNAFIKYIEKNSKTYSRTISNIKN